MTWNYWTCNTCSSFWRAKTAPENSICPGCKQNSTFEGSKFIEGLQERQITMMRMVRGMFREPDDDITVQPFNEKKLANVFQCDVSFIPTKPPEGATYEEKMAMRVEYHITITYSNDQCLDVGGEVKQITIDFLPKGAPKLSDLKQSDAKELAKIAFASTSAPALTSTPAPTSAPTPRKSGIKPKKKSEKKSGRRSLFRRRK